MTAYLAHPLRVGYGAQMTTLDGGTDEHMTQQVAVIIGTHLGERPMAAGFGVPPPAWHGLDTSDIQGVLDRFGPPLTVTSLAVPLDQVTSRYTVTWVRAATG